MKPSSCRIFMCVRNEYKKQAFLLAGSFHTRSVEKVTIRAMLWTRGKGVANAVVNCVIKKHKSWAASVVFDYFQ